MKKIVLFDPSYGTSNLGDHIINEAVMEQMEFLFDKSYLVRYSTHTPQAHFWQLPFRNRDIIGNLKQADLKFLGGSNIIKLHLNRPVPDWNVNLMTMHLYKPSIVIGGGLEGTANSSSLYSRVILRSVLSKDYVHSARDEEAHIFLKKLGLKSINTGCPTTWNLTKEHCKMIPTDKSSRVVFTLTDYLKQNDDQTLIDTLVSAYDEVYFWPQGTGDYAYLKTLNNTESINVIGANLKAFKQCLSHPEGMDYIGTRLHAGIYAMQHKVRSIILIVDNRARDMQLAYNINAIERSSINELRPLLESSFTTDVRIDEAKIKEWKQQFTI